jgi:hypothetical protein
MDQEPVQARSEDSGEQQANITQDDSNHEEVYVVNGNTAKTRDEEINLADIVAQAKSGVPIDKVDKPEGTGGRHFNVRNAIGLADDANWYTDILVCTLFL